MERAHAAMTRRGFCHGAQRIIPEPQTQGELSPSYYVLLWLGASSVKSELAQVHIQCTENGRKHKMKLNHTLWLLKSRTIIKRFLQTWFWLQRRMRATGWRVWDFEKRPEAARGANMEKWASTGVLASEQRQLQLKENTFSVIYC